MNSKVLVGGLFLVGGFGITAVTYVAAEGGGTYTVAWGAMLFGVVQIVIGLAQSSDDPGPPPISEEEAQRVGSQTILRCMINMAATDGNLAESEVQAIQHASRTIFGKELGEAKIREVAQKMISDRTDLAAELKVVRNVISWTDADHAVTGMAMVAMAEGEMRPAETARLEDYAGALEIDQARFDASLARARQAMMPAAA
jgi:tellurite resistance protein